jgi:hypothetical protein
VNQPDKNQTLKNLLGYSSLAFYSSLQIPVILSERSESKDLRYYSSLPFYSSLQISVILSAAEDSLPPRPPNPQNGPQ